MDILFFKKTISSGWMKPLLIIVLAVLFISSTQAQNKPTQVTTVVVSKPETQKSKLEAPGDEIFAAVEQSGQFPGGITKFYEFLSKNIQYPASAKANNIQGRVILNFIIEKDGQLSNIGVLRSIGGGCDEEVVRVMKLSPKWKPGIQNGKTVRQQYTVPISFTLAKK